MCSVQKLIFPELFTLADIFVSLCQRPVNQTLERARDRRVGVADLGNTCSDWSKVKPVGLSFGKMSTTNIADVSMLSAKNVGDICQQKWTAGNTAYTENI